MRHNAITSHPNAHTSLTITDISHTWQFCISWSKYKKKQYAWWHSSTRSKRKKGGKGAGQQKINILKKKIGDLGGGKEGSSCSQSPKKLSYAHLSNPCHNDNTMLQIPQIWKIAQLKTSETLCSFTGIKKKIRNITIATISFRNGTLHLTL